MSNRAAFETMMGTCLVVAALLLLTVCGAGVDAPHTSAAEPAQTPTRPLRVATGPIASFVLKQGDQLTGFSIDLWDALARRLKVDFSWVEFKSSSEQLQAVQRGDVGGVLDVDIVARKLLIYKS